MAAQRGEGPPSDITRVRRERDLLRQLLELGGKDEIQPFLAEALSVVIEVAGARRGYLEVRDDSVKGDSGCFWIAQECTTEDVEEIRKQFSSGIIGEAIATGEVILSVSAISDPRYSRHESVQRNRIQAVLCAPIGADPPFGVLYLQDCNEPGGFTEDAKEYVEVFARHVSTLADRLLVRKRFRDDTDPTLLYRAKLDVHGLVGRSKALAEVLHQIGLIASLDISVLLTGASGTGKTLVARIVHANGPRKTRPFVELNCSTLPETLVESELFGAMPGAHSTAARKIEGKVAAAEGGTLFLDEVAELSMPAQAKLLQLLQSKEYYPLGASRSVKADVRIIAATNTELNDAVRTRKFREDLFYRLQVLPIRVPTLRERREDIAALCSFFSARACETHRLPRVSLSVGAMRAAETSEWPGNIRQLANAMEAAAIRAAGAGVAEIGRDHLFPSEPRSQRPMGRLTFQEETRGFQAELVRSALQETGWNVTETANRLDLTRSHLYNLIKSFGLTRSS
jgi:Nif-specific regulatory protein